MIRLTDSPPRQPLTFPDRIARMILVVLLFPYTSPPAGAQWSADPSSPLMIEGRFIQGDPEVRLAGSNYYFTWDFQYPVKRVIKALDFYGNTLWSTEKPLHTMDVISVGMDVYWPNLFVDHANNSILVQLMQQKQTGLMYILAAKHDPDGVNLWTTGTRLLRTDCNAEEFRMAIDQNNDLFMTILWVEKAGGEKDISVYKILNNGTLQWEVRRLFSGDSTVYLDHDVSVLPDRQGGCFVAWEPTNYVRLSNNSGHFVDSDYRLNRITANGKIAWEKDMILYHCNGKFFYPEAAVDKNGFLYYLWGYHSMQKVHPDGYAVWEPEGIRITEDYNIRYPGRMEVGEDGDIRIFYVSNDWVQLRLIGQRITPDGFLRWGKYGLRLVDQPYGDWSGQYDFASYRDTTLILYEEEDPVNEGNSQANMILIDRDGKKIWKDPINLYNQSGHHTAWAGIAPGYRGQFVIAWTLWNEASDCNFYAQNIFTDGTTGTRSTFRIDEAIVPTLFRSYDPLSHSLLFEPPTEQFHYQLRTIIGQIIAGGLVLDRIQLSALTSGMYLLTILERERIIETRKIIVQ